MGIQESLSESYGYCQGNFSSNIICLVIFWPIAQESFLIVSDFVANLMKHFGVRKGDTVAIYMPMIPEIASVMLACTRIGAVHRFECTSMDG